jgi:peptidoglycan hydrolase-like protein with peptidoglycan-binding domain
MAALAGRQFAASVQEAEARSKGANTEAPSGFSFANINVYPKLAVEQPSSGVPQFKLQVGRSNDALEHEADRIADQVMTGSRPLDPATGAPPAAARGVVQRACAACEGEDRKSFRQPGEDEDKVAVQRVATSPRTPEVTPAMERRLARASGGGRPIDAPTRTFFGSRFGHDFSDVRVHAGSDASTLCQGLNARAMTLGQNIFFNSDEYSPGTSEGRRLLAHELTHTLQQDAASGPAAPSGGIQRTLGDGHDLTAPRFSGNLPLEAAFDNERLIRRGASGAPVRLLQESLVAMGYTLPEFGIDGIFGAETEAAIRQFQTDAGAVLVDGIVGPETMRLFDQHDPSNTAGLGPPQKVGPVASPRPGVGGGCAQRFAPAGVTFALAGATGAGANPAVAMGITSGATPRLRMIGTAPATYTPSITITAPSNAVAQQYRVGFISNVLSFRLEYTYAGGSRFIGTLPTPLKDGTDLRGGAGVPYDAIFVTANTPSLVEDFTANGNTRALTWPDRPQDGAAINFHDNPGCGPLPPGAAPRLMTGALRIETFRTWVAVQHRPTGCVQALHHIDWDVDWRATVNAAGTVATPTSTALNVTVPNGNGSPTFVQGGQVANDLDVRTCVP